MAVTTAPTARPAPMSPPNRRRLLWATVAFAVGTVSGAGIVLAVDDDPSSGAGIDTVLVDAEASPTAGLESTPSGSADSLDRAAQLRHQTDVARCTPQLTSADAIERCLAAGG